MPIVAISSSLDKAKPSVRMGRKATGLRGKVGLTGLPRTIWFINLKN
jgi:hypothetical protein